MLTRPSSCEGCPLHDQHKAIGFMNPEGSGSNGVMLVAEALGRHEAAEGLPLRPNAPAGAILAGILRRLAGHERNHFTITNTIYCQPGPANWLDGAPYEFGAIEHCQANNKGLVERRRPRAIVTLGGVPTRTITGLHGYNQGIKLVRGFQSFSNRPEYFVDGKPIPVIPTYHPSFLLRASKTRSKDGDGEKSGAKLEKAEGGMSLSGVMMRDIMQAIEIARSGPLIKPKMEVIKGNREVMDNLIREYSFHPEWPLYWDIETPRSIDKADDESEIDSIQTNVTQIQFGHDKTRGFVFPGFDAEYVRKGTTSLLSQRGRRMLTWNGWKFDDKVVQGHYKIPIQGINIDLMSAWSWLQPDLPKGLQFATSFFAPEIGPWKHLAFDAEDIYGMYDVVSLAYNDEGIFQELDKRGLRNSYDRHVILLRTEMVEASHRGFPVDKESHDKFGTTVKASIDQIADQIRDLIPEDLLGLEPKRKSKGNLVPEYGYVNTPGSIIPWLNDEGNPKDGGDRVILVEEVPVENDDGNSVTDEDGVILTETQKTVYMRRSVQVFNKKTLETESILRWCRLKPFSVGSPQQKIKYIEYRRKEEIEGRIAGYTQSWPEVIKSKRTPEDEGIAIYKVEEERGKRKITANSSKDAERLAKYKVPQVRNKMKEMKDNTGAKELEKLYKETGDLVFRLLVEIGKLKKLYGTYYKGWKVIDGGVHTTFGLASTGTGQLSSVDPNIQNAPKHSDLAKVFRSCVRATSGKVLIEIDKKSFHAQTLALAARDKAYARLAALDVHSFMTAHRLGFKEANNLLSWSDADILGQFDEWKGDTKTIYKAEAIPNIPDGLTFQQVRDYKSKKVILGIGFKQGAASILEQNQEGYKDKKEVQKFIDLFYSLFPGIGKFQDEITKQAHKDTYLISKWGYIRRFYDVFKWNSKKWNTRTGSMGDWEHGDDFESAVAFKPANHAFGMIKEEMLRLAGYRLRSGQIYIPSKNELDIHGYRRPQSAQEWKASVDRYNKDGMIFTKESEDLMLKYGFINQIHDSLIFHVFKHLLDEALENILKIMREPCKILYEPGMENDGLSAWTKDGLYVDAEAMQGPDWFNMKKLKGI